jgi:hypothetical protein
MSGLDDEQVELSSESDPEDLDLDLLNDIRVEANDIDELDRLISTTKNQFCISISIKKASGLPK